MAEGEKTAWEDGAVERTETVERNGAEGQGAKGQMEDVAERKEGAADPGLEELVEAERITLVDDKEEEYDFLILDRFQLSGKCYLALVSCDEKTDMGHGNDPGEANDITVVREEEAGGERSFFAVTDADELLAVAKMVEERFGHLGGSV